MTSRDSGTTLLVTTCALTRRARRVVADSQAMHRTIAYSAGRCLWGLPNQHTLVIQHDQVIDWHESLPGLISAARTTIAPPVEQGTRVRWAIIANPVHAPIQPGEKRGRRTPLPPERWAEWVTRKLAPALRLDSIRHEPLPTAGGWRHTNRVVHRRVLFSGEGTVTDPVRLGELRRAGVGPGKAYGCGLLLVRPL